MVKRSDLLALNYYNYKKSVFSGSLGTMRYRIEKKSVEGEEPVLEVVLYPGPYCFEKTPDEVKQTERFPFSEEGLQAVANYLNAQYEEQKALWDTVGNGYGD